MVFERRVRCFFSFFFSEDIRSFNEVFGQTFVMDYKEIERILREIWGQIRMKEWFLEKGQFGVIEVRG